MVKIIEQSQDLFDIAISSTVPLHTGGVDKDWIEKRGSASEFGPVFDMLNPKDNHTLIHLIAMGATDRYGINRNGDAFYKSATKLNLYKPDWKSIKVANGTIHHRSPATFTDFIEKGLLQTYKSFEKSANVYKHHKNKPHTGDKIYGAVKSAVYNDKMDRVELLIEVPNKDWGDELNKLASGESIPFSMACFPADTLVLTAEGYVPIAGIRPGSIVMTHTGKWKRVLKVMHKNYTGKLCNFQVEGYPYRIEATEDHPFLGVLSKHKITANGGSSNLPKEKATWHKANIFTKGDTFVHILPTNWPGFEAIENEHIGAALGSVFGGSDTSLITKALLACYLESGDVYGGLFNSSHGVRLSFLGALLDGINCQIDKDERSVHWTDKNSLMVLLIRDLLLSVGIECEINPVTLQPKDGPKMAGLYIEIAFSELAPLIDYSNIAETACSLMRASPSTDMEDRLSYYRPAIVLNSHSRNVSDLSVFNLEVEDDNSYVVGGVIVHNCNVAHDTCSVCGHKAKNRSEYCEHLTNNLTDMLKSGHVVAMANDHMNFFDISRVNRPADRIAWSLTKSAELQKSASADVTDFADMPEIETTSPSKYAFDKAAILNKCCKIEKRIEAVGIKSYPTNKASPEVLKKLHAEKKAELITGLSKLSAYLSLEDFASLFLGNNSEITLLAKSASAYLPTLFTSLQNSKAPLNPAFDYEAGQAIPAGLQKMAHSISQEISLTPAAFQRRAAVGAITGAGLGTTHNKLASNPSDAESQLLYQYGCYTLSFLESQKRLCPLDFENIQNATVCSNFVK